MCLLFALAASCGDSKKPYDVCGCVPSSPASKDYRHAEKHVPLPNGPAQEITVATILSWPVDSSLLSTSAPRAGRELQLFHIGTAFVQAVRLVHSDCDIHIEIAGSASKTAPRVIVETPVDQEYCMARRTIQSQLAAHGITLATAEQETDAPQEINPAIPADVVGLAFQDDSHPNRGSAQVATIWELHPAIITLTQ